MDVVTIINTLAVLTIIANVIFWGAAIANANEMEKMDGIAESAPKDQNSLFHI